MSRNQVLIVTPTKVSSNPSRPLMLGLLFATVISCAQLAEAGVGQTFTYSENGGGYFEQGEGSQWSEFVPRSSIPCGVDPGVWTTSQLSHAAGQRQRTFIQWGLSTCGAATR